MFNRLLICICVAGMIAFGAPLTDTHGDDSRVYAAGQVWDGSVDISWFTEQSWGTDDTPWTEAPTDYYISTPAQLAGLAYIVNGRLDTERFPIVYKSGATGTSDYDVDVEATVEAVIDGSEEDGTTVSGLIAGDFFNNSIEHIDTEGGGSGVTEYDLYIGNQIYDFAGKTIHITADMDLGGYAEGNSAAGPNWMPIGGRFPADIGKNKVIVDSNFNGSIEGEFHTISNIYCNRQAHGNYMLSQGVGLIGALGDLYDDPLYNYGHSGEKESVVKEEVLEGWISSVRNLCVGNPDSGENVYRGYVFANRMVGGIAGRACNAVIENCANYTSLSSTDHKGIGGIVGACGGGGVSEGNGVIRNCYNAGYIYSSSDGCPAGGIVGSNAFSIYNCYNVGRIAVPNAKTLSEGIGSHYGGSYVVDNCYSLNGTFTDTEREGIKTKNGYYYGEATDLVVKTFVRNGNELKGSGFLDEINGNAGEIFVSAPAGMNNGYPVLFWQVGIDPSTKATIGIGNGSAKGKIEAYLPMGGYSEKTKLAAGNGAQVPIGTTVVLKPKAQAPNVLEYYTASKQGGEAKRLGQDYYTVTGNETVALEGSFKTLGQGVIDIQGSSIYEIGVSKTGTVLDNNGKAWSVKDYVVSDGDVIFENDVLTTKAILNRGAVCKDKDKEYTGKFEYSFLYGGETEADENMNGLHLVKRAIGTQENPNILEVGATPSRQVKTWITYADTDWAGDTSDIRGEYTISTARQLAGLAKLVNGGESFAKATIKLEKNISLKNPDDDGSVRMWETIGRASGVAFRGKFDGQNHTISGLTVQSDSGVGGLFGYCTDAEICNLSVKGRVSSKGNTAGIASFISGTRISNCVSGVAITSEGNRAGGIVAQMSNEAVVEDCINKGNINGRSNAGGIAGEALDSAGRITRCANYGNISTGTGSGLNQSTGGLVGYLGTVVDKSANFGTVESEKNKYVGGIAGYTYANTKASTTATKYESSSAIYDSINRGSVTGQATGDETFVGGLVGRADYLIMKNSYTTGTVNSGNSNYLGAVVGGFYKSIYSDVSQVYYSTNGNPTTSYTKSGSIIRRDAENPSLSYFKTQKMTLAQMKETSFLSTLNASSPGSFAKVTSDAPQLTWITASKDITVTFTGDYTGTERTYYRGVIDLPECSDEGWKYVFKVNGSEWDGTDVRTDMTVNVTKEKIRKSYVVFLADGKPVDTNGDGTVDKRDRIYYYCEDGGGTANTYLSRDIIPDDEEGIRDFPVAENVAGREGYTVEWDWIDPDGVSYRDVSRTKALGTGSIKINAVYKQRMLAFAKNDNAEGVIKFEATIGDGNDGYYFLKPQAKGTITVNENAEVVLDGSNGPFTNIRIVAKRGSKLVLKDMDLRTDPTRLAGDENSSAVLEIEGGTSDNNATELRFSGYNNIKSTNNGSGKGSKTIFPAVGLTGHVKLKEYDKDTDTLHVVAGKDNPNIDIGNGATMNVAGGIVEVYRQERLGRNGGMIYGSSFDYTTHRVTGDQKGNLTVSGGSLMAVSDTNNVFAACVDKYTQTGGHALFYATEADMYHKGHAKYKGTDVAIHADKTSVTGGSLSVRVRTHKDAASDPINYYNNAEAIESGDGFNDKYFLYVIDTSDWDRGVHEVKVDGTGYYSGKGNIVSHPIDTNDSLCDKFSEKRSKADPLIYLWLSKGSAHSIEVDGTVVGDKVDENTMEGVKYVTENTADGITIEFFDSSFASKSENGTIVAFAAYDEKDMLQKFVSKRSFLPTDDRQSVSVDRKTIGDAHHVKVFIYDGPKTLRPMAPAQNLRIVH